VNSLSNQKGADMPENFFLDNPDLQFRFNRLDLAEVVAIKEKDYAFHKQFPTAPRSYPMPWTITA